MCFQGMRVGGTISSISKCVSALGRPVFYVLLKMVCGYVFNMYLVREAISQFPINNSLLLPLCFHPHVSGSFSPFSGLLQNKIPPLPSVAVCEQHRLDGKGRTAWSLELALTPSFTSSLTLHKPRNHWG